MPIRTLPLLLLSPLLALAQAPQPAPVPTYENLNAVLWMQNATEYRGLAAQTYRAAERALFRALETKQWTAALEQTNNFENLSPAIILDLDETVFDNSAFQARLVKEGGSFTPEGWGKWVGEEAALAVPGAVKFLNTAALAGVAPIYITNRVCNPDDPTNPTVHILQKLSIPFSPSRLLCKAKESDPNDKSSRRALVARNFRILLLLGDDMTDFVSVPAASATAAGREQLFRSYEYLFGEKWFLLPNPSYGSWERVIGSGVSKKLEGLRQ